MKKKIKQRWIALLMAIVVIVGILPNSTFAEGSKTARDSYEETATLLSDTLESGEHTHSETCYCGGGEKVCSKEESEEHSHGGDCVCPGGELICGQEESEENTHNEESYGQSEGLLYQQNDEINLAAESQYLTVKLNWTGDEGKETLRGSSLQVLVTTNPSAGGTYITLNANSDWQTRTYLPLKDSSGNPYAYTLDIEKSVFTILHAYRIEKCELENGILTVDIAFQETTDIDIELTWDDYNDTMGLRPENASEATGYELYISGSGESYEAYSVSDITDSKCTVTFKDIPTTYYDASGQFQRLGYGQYGLKLTNGNYYELPDTVKVTRNSYGDYWLTATATLRAMEKTIKLDISSYLYAYGTDAVRWAAAEKWGVPVPEKIIFTILSDGQPIEGVEPAVFERNSDGSWTRYTAYSYTWYLPLVNDEGDIIDYGTLTVGVSTDLGDGMPKQYKQNPEKITLTSDSDESKIVSVTLPGVTYLTIRPAWEDDNNKTGVRPATLTATLLADGEPVGTSQTIKTGSSTNVTAWNNLPQLDSNGNYIHYTVRYEGVPSYYTETSSESPAYSEEKGYGSDSLVYLYQDVTFAMKSQTAKATVYWEGDGIGSEEEMVNRPDSTILKLYYTSDGGNTWKEFWGTSNYAVTQGSDVNAWTYEWTALPAIDEEGNPVQYKAVQLSVPAAYSSTVDEPVYTKDDEGNVASSTFSFHNSYNDNWNYTIDLSWNTTNPAEKYEIDNVTTSRTELVAQYLLSISVQKPYKAGEFEIRVPYELFDSRDGSTKGTVPSRFSVGDYTNPSSAYSITYRIDDKGTADTSDDEVVFYNYKDLSASENIQVTVEYKFYPYNVVDCSLGSLTATATARYDGQAEAETQISGPITYRLDTGVEDFTVSKELYELVYSWPSEFGEKPSQFDTSKYNYVIYRVERPNGNLNSNQPAIFEYTDTPGDEGKVVAVQRGYTSSKRPYSGTLNTIYTGWDKEEASATWQETYKTYASVGYYDSYSYYVMVQYPRVAHEDSLNPGQTTYETDYHNEAEFRFVATDEHEGDKSENDKNDVIIKKAASTAHWVDYEFHYDGDLYSTKKYLYSFPYGALDLLQMGKVQSASFDIDMTVNGYELADGYRMDLTDDAVYARATINGKSTEYIRLTEEDYELSGIPYITIECSDIDRSNGATIEGKVSEKPFSVYGRKGNNGAWELLGQISMTGDRGFYRPIGDLTGQGYTAIKIQSPEDLQGKYYVRLQSVSVSIKPESPVFLAWLENGDALTSVYVQNLAAYDLYKSDGEGKEEWINPYTNSSNSLSKEVGLDESDKAEFGAYRHRKNSGAHMYPATWTSGIVKNVYDLAYDTSTETVSVGFNIYAYEGTNTSFDEYPVEKCENGGVFYDLLPPGFTYDASKGMNVYSYKAYGGKEQYAALEDLTVIDNYKDSGRQLLVVKVKSTREDGQNWSLGYSGFYISYYAKASYDDVTSGKTIYNSVAYQRDDLKAISACSYTEDGKPWNNADIWPEDDSGVPVFYDINGDGIVTKDKNTLYGSASFTPSIIQTIQNGLTKRVKGISGIYKSEDVTGLGETYSYKLRLTNQKSGETSNVVIYDILENAANTGGHSGENEGWKGTFASVGTRNLRLQGIQPTVWYSTAQGLSYNDPEDCSLNQILKTGV